MFNYICKDVPACFVCLFVFLLVTSCPSSQCTMVTAASPRCWNGQLPLRIQKHGNCLPLVIGCSAATWYFHGDCQGYRHRCTHTHRYRHTLSAAGWPRGNKLFMFGGEDRLRIYFSVSVIMMICRSWMHQANIHMCSLISTVVSSLLGLMLPGMRMLNPKTDGD